MQPYSSKYANTHRVMLESLPTKALQRLYRLLDAKSAAHSWQVSYLKACGSLTSEDHRVINRHSRQRATCVSQRWGVESVLQRRAKLEWEALNPRPGYLVRNSFLWEREVKLWFNGNLIPANHAELFHKYGRTEAGMLAAPYLTVHCRSKQLARQCEQYALTLKPK